MVRLSELMYHLIARHFFGFLRLIHINHLIFTSLRDISKITSLYQPTQEAVILNVPVNTISSTLLPT